MNFLSPPVGGQQVRGATPARDAATDETQSTARQVASEVVQLPINVSSLFDEGLVKSFGKPGKPAYSYATLMTYAILTSEARKMSLNQIYNWLSDHYPYFKTAGLGWKNSVRHNLSLNKLFVKVPRPSSEPGKGCYWSLDVTALYADPNLTRRIPSAASSARVSPEQEMLDSAFASSSGMSTPDVIKPEPIRALQTGSGTGSPSIVLPAASFYLPQSHNHLQTPVPYPHSLPHPMTEPHQPQSKKPRRSDPGSQAQPRAIATHLKANSPPRQGGTWGLTMHFPGAAVAQSASQPIYYITSPPTAQEKEATPPPPAALPKKDDGVQIWYEMGGVTRVVKKRASPTEADARQSTASSAAGSPLFPALKKPMTAYPGIRVPVA